MASLPPQRPQRRSTPPQQQSSASAEDNFEPGPAQRANSIAPSTTSIDSQTVILNNPTSSSSSPPSESTKPSASAALATPPPVEVPEPRKCWICFSDETEDTPQSSVWRSPCPCALTAHESCLLDWIADIEAPSSNRSTSVPSKITCPQCKGEIKLARPHSFVLDAVNAVERAADQMLLPTVLSGLFTSILYGCSAHGVHTIRAIFGDAEAAEILRPVGARHDWERRLIEELPSIFGPFFATWRGQSVEIGLPLIPLALIASRTKHADFILPFVPLAFFALRKDAAQTLTLHQWPPSAALTITMLPFVRGLYDEYMERVWGPRERKWADEVQPRPLGGGEEEDEDVDADVREADLHAADLELGFEIEVDVMEEVEEVEDEAVAGEIGANNDGPIAAAAEPRVDAQARNAVPQAAQPGRAGRRNGNAAANNGNNNAIRHAAGGHDIVISVTTVASTTLGALLFPTLSAVTGDILSLLLPSRLTQAPFFRGKPTPTGLLQTRWGRNIVGGCLFVALKDAIRIYCRWRMAQAHRARRVVDYVPDEKKRKERDGARVVRGILSGVEGVLL